MATITLVDVDVEEDDSGQLTEAEVLEAKDAREKAELVVQIREGSELADALAQVPEKVDYVPSHPIHCSKETPPTDDRSSVARDFEKWEEGGPSDFKLGVYEHYKGGRYTAIMVVQHHDTRQPMVVYVSHEKGSVNCRPLRGWTSNLYGKPSEQLHDPDGFLDELRLPGSPNTETPRFRYIGPARS